MRVWLCVVMAAYATTCGQARRQISVWDDFAERENVFLQQLLLQLQHGDEVSISPFDFLVFPAHPVVAAW